MKKLMLLGAMFLHFGFGENNETAVISEQQESDVQPEAESIEEVEAVEEVAEEMVDPSETPEPAA